MKISYPTIAALLSFCITERISAQVYNPGDLVVLGFNADENTDLDGDGFQDARWALVALRSLTVGSVIHFTDAGITQTGAFNANSANEGHLTWTITTSVPAGKVFAMDCVDGSNVADLNGAVAGNGGLTDHGTVVGHLGGNGIGVSIPFAVNGDQIIIYQGVSGTTAGANFIYGYNTQQNGLLTGVGVWQTSDNVTAQNQSYLPTGLANGNTAVALTTNVANASVGPGTFGTPNYGFDNMIYAGTRTATRAQLLTAIGNPANHIGNNSAAFPIGIGAGFSIPSDFTITDLLPLTWGEISGTLQNGHALLQWETVQEAGTSHFDVEISGDGVNYTLLIGNLPAGVNSDQPRSYQHLFQTDLSVIFARIKQVDIDGRSTYSRVVLLKDEKSADITILNNPNRNGLLQLSIPQEWQGAAYTIFSTSGSIVKRGSFSGNNASTKNIGISDLTPGVYFIVAYTRNKKVCLSFIKI